MLAKFVTAKDREKLNPPAYSSAVAICLKTSLEMGVMVKRVHSGWDPNL